MHKYFTTNWTQLNFISIVIKYDLCLNVIWAIKCLWRRMIKFTTLYIAKDRYFVYLEILAPHAFHLLLVKSFSYFHFGYLHNDIQQISLVRLIINLLVALPHVHSSHYTIRERKIVWPVVIATAIRTWYRNLWEMIALKRAKVDETARFTIIVHMSLNVCVRECTV